MPKKIKNKKIQKKTNIPKNDKPPFETTTLWDYPKQSYGKKPKGNNKFQGVTPAFIVWNMLQRYTKPGELVVDPMAGSGTTIDVCKEEKRRVVGYDINPKHPRVVKNDSRKIPLKNNSVDMVFIDSPYGDNVRYSDNPKDIGHISAENLKFYAELEKVAREIYRILKPGKVMGWLIGDQWVKKNFTPVGLKVYKMLTENVKFEPIDIVCVTRRSQSSHTGVWHYRAKKWNFFLRGFKYLLLVRKPDGSKKEPEGRAKVNWKKYK